IQYGLAASIQAVRDSGLEVTDANRERIGVAMGSGIGWLTNIESNCRSLHDQGPRRISPFFAPGSISYMISGFLPNHSGLQVTNYNRDRIGVAMESGIGGLTNIESNCRSLHEQGPRRISPFFVPGSIINMISGFLSIHLGLQGPNYAIATACTTGTHCIG